MKIFCSYLFVFAFVATFVPITVSFFLIYHNFYPSKQIHEEEQEQKQEEEQEFEDGDVFSAILWSQ